MKKILLLSDTHNFWDDKLYKYLESVDELWHAGDIGNHQLFEPVQKQISWLSIKAVYGNIDDTKTRTIFPENLIFECEGVKVFITHIGGYPDHYAKGIKEKLLLEKPHLFICGHSHILKVIYDKKLGILHMNPGAAGNYGIHKVKTCLRFSIENSNIKNLEVIEFGNRGL